MDERKLIIHANDYIKKMANGINPLTGKEVSENDLINNIKISRCLFFVSEMLDNYSKILNRKNSLQPSLKFYAKKEDFINFDYSSEPIYISTLAKNINEFYSVNDMKKLSATSISNFLVSKGYLMIYTRSDDTNSKKPTLEGEKLGIKSILKEGKNGPYLVNTYDINAQKFIINNIEEISKSI